MSPGLQARVVRAVSPGRTFQALMAIASAVALAYSAVGYDAVNQLITPNAAPVAGATAPGSRPTISKGIPAAVRPTRGKTEAMNVLVLGTDTREGLSPGELGKYHLGDTGSGGSDTIMLVHLSADGEHATIASFPRDLWVEIPAFEGKSAVHMKINAAYARGGVDGPSLAVHTIETLTNIHIDHFMSINVPSLGRMVDALGGVDVCLPKAIDDTTFNGKSGGSGLVLPAGVSHLDGVKAVAYVRTRHKDTGDGPEDFGRIRRQQKFVAALLAKVMSGGTLTDLGKLHDVITKVASALTLDSTLTGQDLFTIASSLQGLNTSHVTFVTVPVSNADYEVDGQQAMQMSETGSRKLFTELRNDTPISPPKSPSAAPSVPASAVGATPSPSGAASPSGTPGASNVHTAADDPCSRSNG